jgi:hypothetical protein
LPLNLSMATHFVKFCAKAANCASSSNLKSKASQ